MNKTFAKIALVSALAIGGAMTVAQADSRGHDRDDGWHHHQRHEVSRACAEHPRACSARHAERAERRAYRHMRHRIHDYRMANRYDERHHHRRYHRGYRHDHDVRVIRVFPNQFGLYLSIR